MSVAILIAGALLGAGAASLLWVRAYRAHCRRHQTIRAAQETDIAAMRDRYAGELRSAEFVIAQQRTLVEGLFSHVNGIVLEYAALATRAEDMDQRIARLTLQREAAQLAMQWRPFDDRSRN